MLQKLKRIVKREGLAKVSSDLGFKSQTTIAKWIRENKIPDCRKDRVALFLKNYIF